jgi:peptidoglycan hydrolase-like protein with peptidoglycan-binding domain
MSSVQRLGNAGVTPQTNFQPTVNNPNAPQAQPVVQSEPQPQSAPANLNVALASRQGIASAAMTRANLQAAPAPLFSTQTVSDIFSGGTGPALGSLTAQQSYQTAKAVLGDGPGAELLAALDQRNGGTGTLVQRFLALGRHEGGLAFGRENLDPASGFNIGTFQIGGAETSRADSQAKYERNLNVGIQMYQNLVGKTIDRNSLTAADRDALAHVGYIQSERNPAYGNLFAELGNRNLSDAQVVRLMSTKIQGGIDAIGEDVVSMMRGQRINLDAVNARANEPAALRRQPAVPTLEEGYVSPQVETLQRALNQAGGYNLNPDGQFGRQTANAVIDFQRRNGLAADGVVGGRTWDALAAKLGNSPGAPTPTPTPAPAPAPTPNPSPTAPTEKPKLGDTGPAVQTVQNNLVRLGHLTQDQVNTGPGVFGPRTEDAVKAFQQANNLSPSGVADFATQNAMNSIISGVKRGDTGNVVVGLQNRLVELGYLTEAQVGTGRGTFGPQTEDALKRFQADNQIQRTGVLGPQTYKSLLSGRGAGGVTGPADLSRFDNTRVDTNLARSGVGFTTYEPAGNQFGTQRTIKAIELLGQEWAKRHPEVATVPGARIAIGDISVQGGGPFPPHSSHQDGTAFDIAPFTRNRAEVPTNIFDSNYDRQATREMAQLIKRLYPNATVLFNDPQLINEGLTVPFDGHDNHLHVQLR